VTFLFCTKWGHFYFGLTGVGANILKHFLFEDINLSEASKKYKNQAAQILFEASKSITQESW
jgi:hypothetical protein